MMKALKRTRGNTAGMQHGMRWDEYGGLGLALASETNEELPFLFLSYCKSCPNGAKHFHWREWLSCLCIMALCWVSWEEWKTLSPCPQRLLLCWATIAAEIRSPNATSSLNTFFMGPALTQFWAHRVTREKYLAVLSVLQECVGWFDLLNITRCTVFVKTCLPRSSSGCMSCLRQHSAHSPVSTFGPLGGSSSWDWKQNVGMYVDPLSKP